MKTRFSWETEEDADAPADSEVQGFSQPRRHGRRTLLLIVALTIAVFVAMFVYLDHRLETREEAVRQNVLAAHRTWEQAVTSGDLELFTSLLGRDDTGWYHSQRRLLMADRVSTRDAFGLSPGPAAEASPIVKLDANLRRAEVTFPRQYVIETAEDHHQIVNLAQTQLYQARGDSWQVVAPTDTFWGDDRVREMEHLIVSFPSRDTALIERLTDDLEREIGAACRESPAARECSADGRIPIVFDTDPGLLLILDDPARPVMLGRAYLLPAPSLVGLPMDDASYEALYRGYTRRVMSALRNSFALPVPLPDQEIAALCFPFGENELELYTYSPSDDAWSRQQTDRRYSVLQPLPDDTGLIVRAGLPGTEIARLELDLLRGGMVTPLFNEGTTEQSVRLVGISTHPDHENLLLSSVLGSTGLTFYRSLSLDRCAAGDCRAEDLQGFPLWSSDGRRSLILVGSDVYLGDASGTPVQWVDRAFSPFWITDDIFGFIRLLGDGTDEGPDMELALRSAASGDVRPIIQSVDLLRQINAAATGTMRIMSVVAAPNDPNTLFLAGTPVAGAEQFYIIKLSLVGDVAALSPDTSLSRVEVVLSLDDLPVGDRTTLTPTGYRPFSISPDGRWLTVVRFADPITSTWVFYLYDTAHAETKVFTLNYPDYPAPFPFYDWSADGNWLVLIDSGFLRLVAPDYDYERIITHDYDACRYPAWINRRGVGE